MSQKDQPFIVHSDVMPLKFCETVSEHAIVEPDYFRERLNDRNIDILVDKNITSTINSNYGVSVDRSAVFLQSYGTSYKPTFVIENHEFSKNIWFRNKDVDFISFIFLSDHLAPADGNIDVTFEVYGGKLEFPGFDFNVTPARGTSITFPAAPNFLHTISKVDVGQLNVLCVEHTCTSMFTYDPENFTTTLDTWIKML